MGKPKNKHSRNKGNAKGPQNKESTRTKMLGTQAETSSEMHVEGEVAGEIESPNKFKEENSEISTTTESDMSNNKVKPKWTQNRESTYYTKMSRTEEAETSLEIHVEGEVSPEIKSLDTSKEENSEISTTTESDMSIETHSKRKKIQERGINKPTRWSEPWKPRKSDYDDKRNKSVSHIQNVDTRGRKNYSRDESNRTIAQDEFRNGRQLTEFEMYERAFKWNSATTYLRTLEEIDYDLFRMDKEYSLGHCVAEDMNMGSGIAVRFRHEFKRVDELLDQGAKTGGLALLQDDNRFIYYLVTKKRSTGKPTYESLFASLQEMRKHIVEHNIKKLALPRIACGLDRLYWKNVKFMIEFIFRDVDIDIKICNYQNEGSPQLRHKNSRLTNVTYPIQDIEEGTVIVYLSTEDGFISDEMNMLNEKFSFLTEFRFAVKTKGNVIFFSKNQNYLLCGCIVKKKESDLVDFTSFQKCLYSIQRENKKYKFDYIGFQAIKDDDNSGVNDKIINLLRNSLRDVEVYVCWPDDLQILMPRDRFSDYTPRTSLEQERGHESFNQSCPSVYYNKADDSKRANTSMSSEIDWFEESDGIKSRSNESNNSLRTPVKSTATTDWLVQNNNLGSSQGEFSRKEKSRVQTDSWDNSDVDDNETLNSNELDRSLGDTITKTEGILWHSNEQTDKDSLTEDNLLHSKKKAKKSKDMSKVEENMWWDEKQPQVPQFKTDEMHMSTRDPIGLDQRWNTKNTSSVSDEYKEYRTKKITEIKTIREREVHELSSQYSRACYVTEDMSLESGIPFGSNFNNFIGECLNQKQKEGNIAVVKDNTDYLYCLIIKTSKTAIPTPYSVFSALHQMRNHAREHNVRTIVLPKMDEKIEETFNWSDVKLMLEFLGKSTKIQIFLAPFEHVEQKNRVLHLKSGLHQMKKNSIIIYWASGDGHVSYEMNSLGRKFKFIDAFRKSNKQLGNVIKYKEDQDYVLYGCIAREVHTGPIDFRALQQCLTKVNECNKIEKLTIVGIQAVKDQDETVNLKIINVLMSTLQDVTIHMCWPGDLRQKMPKI